MLWWVAAMLISLAIGVVTLAAASAEPPTRIPTFSRSSQAERDFDRRAGRLLAVGCVSVCVAFVMGLISVFASPMLLG